MPLSASKSTSKREISASVAKQHSPVDYRKKNRFQRSKSASPVMRSDVETPCALVEQFLNKRDNPLFCFSSISSLKSLPRVGSEERLQAISKGHHDYYERETDGGQKEFLNFTNESKDAYEPKFQKNKDASCNGYGLLKQRKNLQSSRHPVSDYCKTSYSQSWEDGISIYSSSELEETTVGEAISRTNFTGNIVEVGTENQDLRELVSDIRMEYEKMLKESHERARKLRADLAIEEQREQEINRMLREIMSDENSGPQKSRPWKTLSGEKLEMSRRLAEDAMSYFDECVSLSTSDGSDFSSTVDQQLNSIGIFSPLYESSSLTSDASTFATLYTLNDLLAHPEDVEIQSHFPVSVSGSNLAAISICSSSHDMSLPLNGQKHEKLSNKGRLLGGSNEISSVCEAADNGESLNFRTYIKRFERKPNRVASNSEISSSFNINGYDLDNSAESRLLDILLLKNRIESGSLLLCDIRIF